MSIKLSYSEAYAVIQFHVAELAHKTWFMPSIEVDDAVTDATLRLRWLVGSPAVREGDVYDLLDSYEALAQLDNGTHEDIEVNATYTVDNRPELRRHIEGNIHQETYILLANAGIQALPEDVRKAA
jgi:hypothetical protein